MEDNKKNYIGWGILGFFFPVVGLILFLVWLNSKKGASKAAGLGALIGVVVEGVITMILIISGVGIFGLMYSSNKKEVKITDPINAVEDKDKCEGTFTKGENKYEYKIDLKSVSSTCETATFKLNDDFTLEVNLDGGPDYLAFVNGKEFYLGRYEGDNIYITGKTLVVKEFSTDLGANVLLFNKDGKIYNLVQEGEEEYNPVNQLKIDYLTVKSYKVDDNGDLILSGINHSNQCDYGLKLNGKCVTDNPCSMSYNDLAAKYNIPSDYAYKVDYKFTKNSDGLFNFNYTSKDTKQLLSDYLNSYCQ